jgi:hypothetical protein
VSVVMSWIRGTRAACRTLAIGVANAAATSSSVTIGIARPLPRRNAIANAITASNAAAIAA